MLWSCFRFRMPNHSWTFLQTVHQYLTFALHVRRLDAAKFAYCTERYSYIVANSCSLASDVHLACVAGSCQCPHNALQVRWMSAPW